MSAIVCAVVGIEKHFNADNLEILTLSLWDSDKTDVMPVKIVTGPHYRVGQRGVYVAPDSVIPGYMAEDAWLVGRGKANQWYRVKTKNMRGIDSPGLFFGQFYEKDTRPHTVADLRAEERAKLQDADQDPLPNPVYGWRFWRDHWKLGEDVAAYLGIINGNLTGK